MGGDGRGGLGKGVTWWLWACMGSATDSLEKERKKKKRKREERLKGEDMPGFLVPSLFAF